MAAAESKPKFKAATKHNIETYDPSTKLGSSRIIRSIKRAEERKEAGVKLNPDEEDFLAWLKHVTVEYERKEALKAKFEKAKLENPEFRKKAEKDEAKAVEEEGRKLDEALKLLEQVTKKVETEDPDHIEVLVEKEEGDQDPTPTPSRPSSPTPTPSRPPTPTSTGSGAGGATQHTTSGSGGGSGTGGGGGGSDPDSDGDDSDDNMGRPKGNEIDKIPMFDGTTPDPERWLEAVERVAETFDWAEDRIAKAACLRMDGKAALWLETLVATGNLAKTMNSYKDFKKGFNARFKPLDEAIKATEAIMDLKMKAGESVSEFADRICIGVEKKNASWDEATKKTKEYKEAAERDRFSFMCAGLNDSLRRVVMGGSDPPTDYTDLLKKAVSAESALKAKHSIQELVAGMDGASTSEGRQESAPVEDANTAKIEALEKQLEAIKDGIKCWNCQEVGHTKRFCPKLKGQQNSGGGNRGRGGGARGRGGNRGNWRGGFRGNRGGNWRGRGGGGGRGRGYTPQAYFGQPGYYQQGFQPRYPGVQQLQQGQQSGYGQGYQPPQPYQQPPPQQQHQQYEIIEMPGNF